MIIAVIAAAVLVTICFAVGGYIFFSACGRGKNVDWTDEKSVKSSDFDKFSEKVAMGNQWLREHQAQDLYMESRDGLRLHALWIPAPDPRATVVFAHGYHSTGRMDFALAFDMYYESGFNILMPDQRAHNDSQGKYITFGVKESGDFLDWIRLHNQRFGDFPILCSGLSMGASTFMYLAGQTLPDNVRGFVVDCGFTSPKEIISKVVTDTIHLPAWPFMWAAEIFARVFGGFSLSQMHSTETLARNTRPILMVHGLADDFVPSEMTKRGYASCQGEKYLLLVEGAGHALSFLLARDVYMQHRNMIVERVLDYELRHN